jgi:hypothetical protein
MSPRLPTDEPAFGSPRDPAATSRKLLRLEFLRLTPELRQQTRARVQATVNAELRRQTRNRPSPLALALATGMYDEPRPGELEALEAWAKRRRP